MVTIFDSNNVEYTTYVSICLFSDENDKPNKNRKKNKNKKKVIVSFTIAGWI